MQTGSKPMGIELFAFMLRVQQKKIKIELLRLHTDTEAKANIKLA